MKKKWMAGVAVMAVSALALSWSFGAQEAVTESAEEFGNPGILTDLIAEDVADLTDLTFDPDQKTYDLTVFEDVYGVRFTPSIAGDKDSTIEVTMSGTGLESETFTVKKNETFELHLTQSREANITGPQELQEPLQENDCDYVVTITDAQDSYTVNVHRPGTDALVEQFEKLTWPVPDDSGKTMDYYLYLPDDYATSGEAYPVLIVPHGGGQFYNDSEDTLVRTAQATSMVKYGKECIVISPQANYSDLSLDRAQMGWCDTRTLQLSVFGEGTMQILENLEADHEGLNVDEDRIYVGGGSMGGIGTCGFLATYPDVFAAGIICTPAFMNAAAAEVLADAVGDYDIPVWFVHAEADPVIDIVGTEIATDVFDAHHVNYNETIYTDSQYFYPTAHFCWVPFFDNEKNLDWLLSQTKKGHGELTDLLVEDSAGLTDFDFADFQWDEETGSYILSEPITVFEDVYGLRFTPTIAGNAKQSISVSVDTEDDGLLKVDLPYTYDDNIWTDGVDGEKSIEVLKNQKFVLHLSEKRLCSAYQEAVQEHDCTYTLTITDGTGVNYVLTVVRPGTDTLTGSGDEQLDGNFELLTWPVPDGSGKEMYYYLYVPADYDESRAYPVVIVPHGGGQFYNPIKDVLVRTAQPTGFVHYGKDCIIIVPQGNYTDLSMDRSQMGWCDRQTLKLSPFGEGVMEILADVEEKYQVDENRIYVAGGSMGGIGTCGFLATYPEVFAGATVCCPAGGTGTDYASLAAVIKEYNIPVWLLHSEVDSVVSYSNTSNLRSALDEAGASYHMTIFSESDFLYPTNHFCWLRFFDSEQSIDWLLAQSK